MILVYDVESSRDKTVLRIAKKYLNPVQESVLEGYLSEKKLTHLKNALENAIDPRYDHVKLYEFPSTLYAAQEELGRATGNTDFII